jgi:hypothetical protein
MERTREYLPYAGLGLLGLGAKMRFDALEKRISDLEALDVTEAEPYLLYDSGKKDSLGRPIIYAKCGKTSRVEFKGTATEVLMDAIDATDKVVMVKKGDYLLEQVVNVKDKVLMGVGKPRIYNRGLKVEEGGIISGFYIDRVVGNGIEVAGHAVGIFDNYISEPSQDGIYINGDAGAENFYRGNIIQSAERYAINFERTETADIGGHYFSDNLIGNVSATVLTDAGVRFNAPIHSASYIWWYNNVIDGIKNGPAMIIVGAMPVTIVSWTWITTGKDGIAIVDIKDCDKVTIKDAFILGLSGCTGIIWRGTNDSAFIDGVYSRGISKLFALDTGASLPNKQIGFIQAIDITNPSDIDFKPQLDGVTLYTAAGAISKYIGIVVAGTFYKIALYAPS